MSMLNYFFSNLYTDKKTLFEDLSVWKEEKYQRLQGTYPVIFIRFAAIKGADYQDARIMLQNMVKKCRKMLQEQMKNTKKSNETH